MNTYRVTAADRDTGDEIGLVLHAATPAAAGLVASRLGLLVGSIDLEGPASHEGDDLVPWLSPIHPMLQRLERELQMLRSEQTAAHRVARRFNKAPIWTIAWGVFCGLLLWLLATILFWFVIFVVLGISLAGAAASY